MIRSHQSYASHLQGSHLPLQSLLHYLQATDNGTTLFLGWPLNKDEHTIKKADTDTWTKVSGGSGCFSCVDVVLWVRAALQREGVNEVAMHPYTVTKVLCGADMEDTKSEPMHLSYAPNARKPGEFVDLLLPQPDKKGPVPSAPVTIRHTQPRSATL